MAPFDEQAKNAWADFKDRYWDRLQPLDEKSMLIAFLSGVTFGIDLAREAVNTKQEELNK